MRFSRIPKMNVLIRVFLLTTLGLTSAVGQSEDKGRLFSCFVWDDLGMGQMFYSDGSNYKELSVRAKRRSEYYPMPSGETFRLFSVKEVNGKMVHKLIGEALIKTNSKRLLLIIVRNPASETDPNVMPLRIVVMDDSISNFPGGSTKFINLTTKPLTAEINGNKITVNARAAKILRPSIPENGGFVPLFIHYQDIELYGTRIFCQEGERRIIFMRINPKQDRRRPLLIDFLPQVVGPSFADE